MSMEKNALSLLKGLSEDDKQAILARQAEQRLERPIKKVRDLSSAEIAILQDFKLFCEQSGTVPTKRQASKRREEFIKWCDEKNPE